MASTEPATYDDLTFDVRVAGPRDGTPVVLLHGFPQTHLMWRHAAPRLAETHTVICPDLRGYGASSKPAGGYDKRTMAADVVGLARALGHERFALAGHDRGALVAFRAGLDHPRAIMKLPMSREAKRLIMGENALRLFNIPTPAGKEA